MQKTLIIIDTNTRSTISATGEALKYSSDYPVIERGQWQILCYQFYNKETDSEGLVTLTPISFEPNTSFVLVGDNNFQDDDSLMLKSIQSITPFSDDDPTSNMFNISGDWIDGSTADPALGQLSVRINSDTEKFKTVLGDSAKILSGLYLNLKQYTIGVSAPSTVAWTNFAGYNTVRDWSSAQVTPPTGTEAISFINTYFRNPLERIYSVSSDGEYDSSYDSSQDTWYKERISGIGAEWSAPIPLLVGPKGDDGDAGAGFSPDVIGLLSGLSTYDDEPAGFTYLASDTGNVYFKLSVTTADWSNPVPFKSDTSLAITAIVNPATAIPAVSGVAYTYTLTGSESLSFGTPAAGLMPTFELHLTQPATPVSFMFATTILWFDDTGNLSSTNIAPDFSAGDCVYALTFRYDGTDWLGNLAYTKEIV